MKLFISIGLLFVALLGLGQTEGTMEITTTTSETGGKYAPRHVMAIWIENESGEFVKTLLAYGEKRRTHLNNWQKVTGDAGSEYNTTDAITGATQRNHGTKECSWDGTNFKNDTVSDGIYKLCMELTDKNETGNYATFDISKSNEAYNLTPEDVTSFSSISIAWNPVSTVGISKLNSPQLHTIYPSPTTGPLTIVGKGISAVKIISQNGKTMYRGSSLQLDISSYPRGIYTVAVFEKDKIYHYKFMKL